jgi:hypothetical protein
MKGRGKLEELSRDMIILKFMLWDRVEGYLLDASGAG